MKITCTIQEFKAMVETCYGQRVFQTNPCTGCVMSSICKGDGINADIEILEIERRHHP